MSAASPPPLNTYITTYLETHDLSLRKFSQLVDISVSTLSRILNGKQEASVIHLQKLSTFFNCSINDLLNNTSALTTTSPTPDTSDWLNNSMDDFLEFVVPDNPTQVKQDMKRDFDKCLDYAATEEGRSMVKEQFEGKLNTLPGEGGLIKELRNLYSLFLLEPATTIKALWIVAVLLYFIMPLDAIPDFLFGIGYLDDLLILQFGLNTINKLQN